MTVSKETHYSVKRGLISVKRGLVTVLGATLYVVF